MKTYHCPKCKKLVEESFTTSAEEPFTHSEPLIGLRLWGAYSAPKQVHCTGPDYVHFTVGGVERLVFLFREEDPALIYFNEQNKS